MSLRYATGLSLLGLSILFACLLFVLIASRLRGGSAERLRIDLTRHF